MKFTRRGGGYSSFRGEVRKIAENKLNREFKVSKLNKVWLTDITEFKIDGSNKKLSLSPIMDLFNGEILSFGLSTAPTVKLATDALDIALELLPKKHGLMIHSDQSFHYQHFNWVNRLKEKKIIQSMSRRGNCIYNSPMENFLGLLKQEMYYGEKYSSINELKKRIKEKLNGLSPIEYRQQAA